MQPETASGEEKNKEASNAWSEQWDGGLKIDLRSEIRSETRVALWSSILQVI